MDQNSNQLEDIISLRQILTFFWKWKMVFIGMTFLFGLGSIVWVKSLPDEYQANILVVPNEAEGNGGLASLAGQFGGLASLAGVNLGGEQGGESAVALSILESRDFIMRFIDKYNLLPVLFAVEEWNSSSQELVFNEQMYDVTKKTWSDSLLANPEAIPSEWDGYTLFINRLDIIKDSDSGVVNIYFEHYSPVVAVEVVENLVSEINAQMRASAMKEAEKSILYLEDEVGKTQVAELQTVFYRLVEEQTKNLMLAKVREDYIFRVVSNAVLPEDKSSPHRAFLVIVITFIGFLFSLFVALILDSLNVKGRK